jgi:hypothetical protein
VSIEPDGGAAIRVTTETYLRNADVLRRELGAETVLYTSEMKAVHVLNRTARLIWEMCDGHHTLADMERHLRTRFAVGMDYDLVPDIQAALRALLAKGLVTAVNDAP